MCCGGILQRWIVFRDTPRSEAVLDMVRFKQAVRNVVELFTFCHRFEKYLCSVCEFERGGVSMGHYF